MTSTILNASVDGLLYGGWCINLPTFIHAAAMQEGSVSGMGFTGIAHGSKPVPKQACTVHNSAECSALSKFHYVCNLVAPLPCLLQGGVAVTAWVFGHHLFDLIGLLLHPALFFAWMYVLTLTPVPAWSYYIVLLVVGYYTSGLGYLVSDMSPLNAQAVLKWQASCSEKGDILNYLVQSE